MGKTKERCVDCGCELGYRTKDLFTEKFLKTGLCYGCFRIMESEEDPESTKYLNIEKYKRLREEDRKKNKQFLIELKGGIKNYEKIISN